MAKFRQWLFNGRPVTETYPIERFWGFIYVITHKPTKRKYVGRKACWYLSRRKPVTIRETDWYDYWGSSKHLKRHMDEVGQQEFRRDILEWHTDQWSLHDAEKHFLFAIKDWSAWYNSPLCLQYYKTRNCGRYRPKAKRD